MGVFISHISEEASIALTLKEWIESTFLGQWEVFVSSDSDDIPAGSKWLDKIDSALENARVLVILCSAASTKRPWINFEAGCAWIKRVSIIPVCHSGMTKSRLLIPLSLFQALDIDDDDFPQALFCGLAKHLGVKRLPQIDYRAFHHAISQALAAVSAAGEEADESVAAPQSEARELGEIETRILTLIAELGDKGSSPHSLAGRLQMPKPKVDYYLEKMNNAGLLQSNFWGDTFYLDQNGRAYLVEHGLL